VRLARIALIAFLAGALLVAAHPLAAGEHTKHHRYYVTGTVTDDLGRPLCGVTVRAADLTAPNSDDSDNRTATTDASGSFTIQLHMHDGDVADGALPSEQGATILVSLEGTTASRTVLATANGNSETWWGEQVVDLSAPPGTADRCGSGALLLPIGIGLAVGLSLIAVVWMRRRPRGLGKASSRALMAVPGMTRARARELGPFGIRTVKDLAAADPEELSKKTNLTPKEARLLVKRAQEHLRGGD